MKPGDTVKVLLDDEKHEFTMTAGIAKPGEMNLKAPLAILLNIMNPGDTVNQWTSREGRKAMRVELVERKQQEEQQ